MTWVAKFSNYRQRSASGSTLTLPLRQKSFFFNSIQLLQLQGFVYISHDTFFRAQPAIVPQITERICL